LVNSIASFSSGFDPLKDNIQTVPSASIDSITNGGDEFFIVPVIITNSKQPIPVMGFLLSIKAQKLGISNFIRNTY